MCNPEPIRPPVEGDEGHPLPPAKTRTYTPQEFVEWDNEE